MVWFNCEGCGESIKKPKIQNHMQCCSSSHFTCIDCQRTFDRYSVKNHSTCVTEHEKYAQGATKPGGFAAGGFFAGGAPQQAKPNADQEEVVGMEFLSMNRPFRCSICNVECTSQETLLSHAGGIKHKRRSRAAKAAAEGPAKNEESAKAEESPVAAHSSGAAEVDGSRKPEAEADQATDAKAGSGKKKKRIREAAADGDEGHAGPAAVSNGKGSAEGKVAEAVGADCEQLPNGGVGKKQKWKKLGSQALAAKGGKMQMKKLVSRVLKAAGLRSSGEAPEAAKAAMVAKWKKSAQFRIEDGVISLCT